MTTQKEKETKIEIKEIIFNEKILLKVREFDCINFYQEFNLSPDWYLARYIGKPVFLAYDNNKIIGYIGILPIKKELYDTIVNGVIYDDIYVNPNMYVNDSPYIYIPSILVDRNYRGNHLGIQLLETLLDKYKNRYLCCITISEGGYKLFNKYFQHKCNIIKVHDVFIKDP